MAGFPPSTSRKVATGLLTLIAILTTPNLFAADPTPEELLKILKTRDAQFENVKFEYTMSGEQKFDPSVGWQYFDEVQPQQNPKQPQQPPAMKFIWDDTLIIREKEHTFIRTMNPGMPKAKPGEFGFSPFELHKWSDAKGFSRELIQAAPQDSQFNISQLTLAPEQAQWILFAHGVGFGRKLKRIERLEKHGAGWELAGDIQVWKEDVSLCRLRLDENLLVRRAHIECDVHGNKTSLDTTSDGLVRVNKIVLAKSGTFKRTGLGRIVDGNRVAIPKTADRFAVDFQRLNLDLDEKTYQSLIEFKPQPGTPVRDQVANKRYKAGNEASAQPLRP